MIDDADDGYSTDKELATSKKKASASKPHAVKTMTVTRQSMLEKDEHTTNVAAHQVTCVACNQKIKLHSTWMYDNVHWVQHKATCPRITLKLKLQTV